jgi:PAS domain S-box-containing protein
VPVTLSSAALIALALAGVTAAARDAAAEQLAIKTYNTEAGLAHNRVKRIVQDSHGFLWFCTADGLSRFDGSQFTNYRFEDGLLASSLNDLLEASDGVYWIATNSIGVVRFDLAGTPPGKADLRSRFTTFPISRDGVSNRVNVLYRDRAGTLWAGTDGGLFQLIASEKAFRPVALHIPAHPDIEVQVWALAEDAAHQLWIGTRFGIVRRLADGSVRHYQVNPSAGDDNVAALVFEPGGRVWIGHRSGLITFVPQAAHGANDGEADSQRIPADARRYTTRDGLDNDHVVALHRSRGGAIWIRTFGAGLTRYDGSSFQTYLVGPRAGEDVLSVIEDRDGNLWTGTRTVGALRVTTQPWTTYNAADGLGEQVNAVIENRAGEIYVTSGAWRVSRFDGRSFMTVRLPLPRAIKDETWRGVTSVIQDHLGDWWSGTRAGLYRFGRVDRFEDLAHAGATVYRMPDGLASDDVTRLFEDPKGDVWIAAWAPIRDVLVRWERATGTFHRYGERDGLRSFTSAQSFATDRAGNVWIGFREGGLARYRDGRFLLLGSEDGLPEGAINGMYVEPAGRVWAAFSGGGVGRIDAPDVERPRVVPVTAEDGLTTDLVLNITGDTDGRIYVTGARGIDRLDPNTRKVTHYSTADGLVGGEFLAALRDRTGALWFASTTGLSRLRPERDEPVSPPPILIGGLRIAGIVHPLSALGQAWVPHLELDTRQNNIQIEFFGMGFRSGETLRYQYRLDGAGSDWSIPGPQRTVNFANLSPGSYRFAVRAVATDGTRSVSPATVSFTILPPVWRRWWFLGLVAVMTAAAAGVFARSRYQRIRSLRESENRFRTLAETASDAIITIDEDSRIVLVNQAAQKIFGYTSVEMIGAELTMLMPAHLHERHHAGLDRYRQTRQRHMSWDGVALPGRHKDGHEIPLEISFGEFTRNDRVYFTGIARDITERKKAEEALRRSREERFAELERVRKRIATDLHDDIGSSLTRISLLSEVAKQQIDGGNHALSEPLTSIAGLSRQLVDSMSDIVWAINPERDHLSDLSGRMRHFVSDLCTARQIAFRFDTPPPERDIAVGANVRRELFLLFKEAVTNMARHSGCSEADLEFREDERGLFMQVADNGRGFDVGATSDGHGLLSMRRRTEALGGLFDVLSAPGRGTILTFTIPLKERAAADQAEHPYMTMR